MKRRPIWTTIAAVCLAGSLPFFAPQTRADEAMMKLEQNKAIVRDYLNEIVNKGNMAAFDIFFSDHHLIVRDQIAEDDKVVTRVTFHGTHGGPFNGIAATGKVVEWSGIAMDRIADGKVVEMWHVQNTAALLQQIGTKPPAASAK